MKRQRLCRPTSAWIVIGVLAATFLAGCVAPGVEETVLPARIDYVCANNRVLPVARGADGRQAAVRVDGKDIVLARAGSAAQEKYSDGRYSLYLDGERAMLEDQSRVIFGPCTSPVPLPSTIRERY
jgi:membrane-bound inhibitor of C-type lysozyme